MARDDWKYHDEEMEDEVDEGKKLPSEKECPNCLHWVSIEAPSCSWCGKPFEDI
jgi:hypothetical protein